MLFGLGQVHYESEDGLSCFVRSVINSLCCSVCDTIRENLIRKCRWIKPEATKARIM